MMDDFKSKKPATAVRAKRKSTVKPNPSLDDEIGDAFVPPDQVAAAEETSSSAETIILNESQDNGDVNGSKSKNGNLPGAKDLSKSNKNKTTWKWWPPKALVKKQWFIVGGAALAIILLVIVLVFVVFKNKTPVKPTIKPRKTAAAVTPKPTTVPSRLTGLPVSVAQSKLPVTGVMIENSIDARPQSGLDQAGIVYEAVAEGGVTRFLALFEDNQPDYIGPIRSARPYYVRWLLPFDASYAHVGGSPDGLADIKALGVKDLDQFANGGYYKRIDSRDPPHNVYTSISQLLALEKTKHYDTSTFTGFGRKSEAPAKVPDATSIDFTISGPAYSAHFDYDPAYNNYKRSEAGAPHMVIDQVGNQTQLAPKVVIALVMSQSSGALDASGAYYTQYETTGTGVMYLFQDGNVIPGTWTKNNDSSQFTFADDNGKPVALNAGQTWISVVGLSGDVAYK